MITPETRKAAGDVYAAAQGLRNAAEASIAPIVEKTEKIQAGVEAMLGFPVVGCCEACLTLIVEGDEYMVDDNGMLLCGKLQGAIDQGPTCVDGAREEYVPDPDDVEPEAAHG